MSTDEREAHLLAQLLQADTLPGVFVSALRPRRDIADESLGLLAHAMNFVKIGHKGPIHIAPPDDIVRNITARPFWPLAPLEAIIEFPVFRPDGTLILHPGYDTTTRLYYAPNPKLVIPPSTHRTLGCHATGDRKVSARRNGRHDRYRA